MWRLLIVVLVLAVAGAGGAWCSPTAVEKVVVKMRVRPDRVVRPLQSTLFGVNVHPSDKPNLSNPAFISATKDMGFTSCRFPNGCTADLYNWKDPGPSKATVDEFLDFCDATASEPYYTVNMQGGIEGLAGPPPAGAALDEVIKYRHTAPNPCGDTNYYFGTLAEALELLQKHTIDRAVSGRRPILHYEMGNENWGQSRTDWPPEVYAKTVEAYARAMRAAFDKAKAAHKELADKQLYIVAVGYPVMGNNMKDVDTPDRKINVSWTKLLNKLHDDKLIDAVQEHFYPYASANGGGLAWAVHNLHNIVLARKDGPNVRLTGYRDPEIAYNMPMEHTEWNVKCWGSYFSECKLTNGGFEDGLAGWTVTGEGAKVVSEAARHGAGGLAAEVESGVVGVAQVFAKSENAKVMTGAAWVRTDKPGAVVFRFKQSNAGEHAGASLSEYKPRLADMWEKVLIPCKPFADTREIEMAVQAEAGTRLWVDELKVYYSSEERGQVPLSAQAFEQELFVVDALRELALNGCPRAHLHHLAGNYPCGAMTSAAKVKDLGKAFEFFAGAYGDQVVHVDCDPPNYGYYSAGNAWATDFNALAPDRDDIPMLGQMATVRDKTLYLLLLNRTSDREIDVSIDLGAEPAEREAVVRTLSGEDIDIPGCSVTLGKTTVAWQFKHGVPPYTAQIIIVKLK